MKHNIHILIAIIASIVMIGCTANEAHQKKKNTNVDSAIDYDLDSMTNEVANDMGHMPDIGSVRYTFLKVKVNEYMYMARTKDAFVKKLIAQHEKGGDRRLLTQVYIYAGLVYTSLNDTPQAMTYFVKAMELVRGTDIKLESLVYSEIGYLISRQWTYEEAFGIFEEASKYYENAKDSLGIFYGVNEYVREKEASSALPPYSMSMGHRHNMDSILHIAMIDIGQKHKLLSAYKQSETENVLLKEENTSKTLFIYLMIFVSVVLLTIFVMFVLYAKEKRRADKYKIEKYTQQTENKKTNGNIEDTDIYNDIQQIINNPKARMRLSEPDWERLAKAVNSVYPGFDDKLAELCKMSLQDYRACLLLKTNVPLFVIAEFLSLTKSGVTSLRTKLYSRAFNKRGSASAWDEVIRSI